MTALDNIKGWSKNIVSDPNKKEIYKKIVLSKNDINLYPIAYFSNVFDDIVSDKELLEFLITNVVSYDLHASSKYLCSIFLLLLNKNLIKEISEDQLRHVNLYLSDSSVPRTDKYICVNKLLENKVVDVEKIDCVSCSFCTDIVEYLLRAKNNKQNNSNLDVYLERIYKISDYSNINSSQIFKFPPIEKYLCFVIENNLTKPIIKLIDKMITEKNLHTLFQNEIISTNPFFLKQLNEYFSGQASRNFLGKVDISQIFKYMKLNKKSLETLFKQFQFRNMRKEIREIIDSNEIGFVLTYQTDITKHKLSNPINNKTVYQSIKFMTLEELNLFDIEFIVEFDIFNIENLSQEFLQNKIKEILLSNSKTNNTKSAKEYIIKLASDNSVMSNHIFTDKFLTENLVKDMGLYLTIVLLTCGSVSSDTIKSVLEKYTLHEVAKCLLSFNKPENKKGIEKIILAIPAILELMIEEKLKNTTKKHFENISKISKKRTIECLYVEYDEQDKTKCKICLENQVDSVYSECGHTLCSNCSDNIIICPYCRKSSGVMKLHFS